MDKTQVVEVLREMALYLELSEANPFEVMAYQNGADSLDDWGGDLAAAVADGSVGELPGIGKGLSRVVTELVQTGASADHAELKAAFPETILELTDVQGLGPKKIKRLHAELGIGSLAELEEAARGERIRALKGFGAKSEERILKGIEGARKYGRHAPKE